jgi:hypothetical protein
MPDLRRVTNPYNLGSMHRAMSSIPAPSLRAKTCLDSESNCPQKRSHGRSEVYPLPR